MFAILQCKSLTPFSEEEKTQLCKVFHTAMHNVFGLSELAFEIDGIEHTPLYKDDEFIHRTYQLKEYAHARVGDWRVQFKGVRFFATKERGLLDGKETTLYHVQMSYIGSITLIDRDEGLSTIPHHVEVTELNIEDIKLTTPLRNIATKYVPKWVRK